MGKFSSDKNKFLFLKNLNKKQKDFTPLTLDIFDENIFSNISSEISSSPFYLQP
jgi:hypothetical protein